MAPLRAALCCRKSSGRQQLPLFDESLWLCIAPRSYFVGPHRIDHAYGYSSDYYHSEHRHFNCPRSGCLSVGL